MKYVVILGDGMAGFPLPDRGDKTTLQLAKKPFIDALAKKSLLGTAKTVPAGFAPGSDVANLSVMGYDPAKYYSGRSPLEAASIGIDLKDTDATLRCNLVTLSEGGMYEDKTMIDYSAGEISTEEANQLIASLKAAFSPGELYAGVSYRHAAVIRGGKVGTDFTPPHDITGKKIADYLPKGLYGDKFRALIEKSIEIFKDHPVNTARIKAGKRPATSVWFWGEGTKPRLDKFEDMFGKKGAVISAVDLVKGIGIGSGMTVYDIPTATGTVDTDYESKAAAAVTALKTHDFVFIHLEGPDECGHQGDRKGKITAIERIDERIVKPLLSELKKYDDYAICIMPDHATPLSVRTHTRDAIPFLIYDSGSKSGSGVPFSEKHAKTTGLEISHGYEIIRMLFGMNK